MPDESSTPQPGDESPGSLSEFLDSSRRSVGVPTTFVQGDPLHGAAGTSLSRGGEPVSRQPHKLETSGAIPLPATRSSGAPQAVGYTGAGAALAKRAA